MNKKISSKPVYLSQVTFNALSLEKAKDGRTLKAIVDDAIKMYIEYKESERLLRKDIR